MSGGASSVKDGQQIYTGFFNYALGQGADQATAKEFANLGLGVAASEGPTTGFAGSNPDPGHLYPTNVAVGPFQLGTTAWGSPGIYPGMSADAQIQQAASTMWGEPGTGGSYNTGQWYGPRDQYAPGQAPDSAAAQYGAIAQGQSIADAHGYTVGGGTTDYTAANAAQDTAQDAPDYATLPGPLGDPSAIGNGTQNVPTAAAGDLSAPLSKLPQGLDIGAITGGLPKGLASVIPGASILGAGPTADASGGTTFDSSGPPVEVTNISAEGQIGQQAIAKATAAEATATGKAAQIEAQQQQTSTLADITGATSLVGSVESALTNLMIRGGFILLALALLAGAWVLLGNKDAEKTLIA